MSGRWTWLGRLLLLGHLTGLLMLILAGALLPAIAIAWWDHSGDLAGLLSAALVAGAVGAPLFASTRGLARAVPLTHREGLLIVGTAWAVAGAVGALPYYLFAQLSQEGVCLQSFDPSGLAPIGVEFCHWTNALFESVSGFSTTGATILNDGLWGAQPGLTLDGRVGLPRGILLWRATTHFLGGMGIVVLGVAILPLLGVGGMQLFKAEMPGPVKDKLAPRVTTTARLLWEVYLILSALLFVLLWAGGMGAFEALCHSMSTMASGGFSTRALSISAYQSPYIEWVNTIFMFLAGVSFTLHWRARRGGLRPYLRDPEFRVYLLVVLVATGLICSALLQHDLAGGFFEALRLAAFQVVSLITSTGYASVDYETWQVAPVALFALLGLYFVGGMAGSTAGGVKVVRHMLMVHLWVRELFWLVHPQAVRPIRLAGRVVPLEVLRAAVAFIGVYMSLVVLGTGFYALDGHDLLTAFTTSAAMLGNVGPGLGDVGPFDNYFGLSAVGKWGACVLMLAGRLEIYTLLVLFSPTFWRH